LSGCFSKACSESVALSFAIQTLASRSIRATRLDRAASFVVAILVVAILLRILQDFA
jgi:hypothetical protein